MTRRRNPHSPPMRAWIGLGANLGDPATTFAEALRHVDALAGVGVCRISSVWRSAPLDAPGPDYHNAAAELRVQGTPQALLAGLLRIEDALGRTRPFRHAPRIIDLDFLLARDDEGAPVLLDTAFLRLPHPRLHERAFALAPLAELDPALDVPGQGSVATLLEACAGQPIERIAPLSVRLRGKNP